jgi:hypothetical protein
MTMQRGSEQLADRLGKSSTLSADDLQRVVEAARGGGAQLVNWWIRGQPAVDGLVGVTNVKIGELGGVVQRLGSLSGVPLVVKVFPYGIPVVDFAMVEFGTPGGQAG